MEFLNDPMRLVCLGSAAGLGLYLGRLVGGLVDSTLAWAIQKYQVWSWRRRNPEDAELHDRWDAKQREQHRAQARKALEEPEAAPQVGMYH